MLRWCFVFILLSQSGFGQAKADPKINLQDSLSRVIQGTNAFGVELYSNLRTTSPQNFCLSPFSVSTALAMPYAGAAGGTQYQMQKILHWQITSPNLDEALSTLNQRLFSRISDTSDDFRLLQANSMWLQSGLQINPDFQKEMDKYYRGSFRRTDFAHQIETSRSEINSLVRERTFGKIPMVLSQGEINTDTRMVIVNTLYLKAKWTNPFDPRVTHQEPFFADSDSTQSVPMMVMTADLLYYKSTGFTIVELPYITKKSTELSMLILLPQLHEGLPDLEKQFNPDKLQQWIASLKNERIYILLPKFRFVSSLNLNNALVKLGMIDAFSDRADFSGITKNRELRISNVFQKTFIAVDEAGTEAAAATSVGMGVTSIVGGENPTEFRVDHPFMFVILDKSTGVILFIGRCGNPGSN